MSSVFISYAEEDAAFARMVADALQRAGFSVWWDRQIPPGKTWDDAIGRALDDAGCVIVLWSGASVKSRWVREEAERAASRNCLVPVFIEKVEPPFGFGRIQAADLSHWRGGGRDSAFSGLVQAVSGLVGVARNQPAARARRMNFLWIAGGVILVIIGIYVAWNGLRPPSPAPVAQRQADPPPPQTIGQRHNGCVDFADPVTVVGKGPISKLAVYHDGYIHGIRVWYGAEGVGEVHGYTAGMQPEIWSVPENERIVRVVGGFAPATGSCKVRPQYVCRIQFFTNVGAASPSFGTCPGGTGRFEVKAAAGAAVQTISGWANLKRHECLNRAVAGMTFHFGSP